MLSVENKDIYICRKGIRRDLEINLLLISEGGIWHYTTVKSLSRLLSRSNSKHHGKQHFCNNCLQSFMLESRRDKHQVYCEDKEAIRVEMPRKRLMVEFCDGQNQFKVPFVMYVDFELILEPIQGAECPASRGPNPAPMGPSTEHGTFSPYTSEVTKHSPSG